MGRFSCKTTADDRPMTADMEEARYKLSFGGLWSSVGGRLFIWRAGFDPGGNDFDFCRG
jgi:hypothetical protein